MTALSAMHLPSETGAGRAWVHEALATLAREAARSADTHLLQLAFPAFSGIDFYF
jgi:cysteine synthase A